MHWSEKSGVLYLKDDKPDNSPFRLYDVKSVACVKSHSGMVLLIIFVAKIAFSPICSK